MTIQRSVILDGLRTKGKNYEYKNIRALLTEGFSKGELLDFCFDEADFKSLYCQLSQDADKAEIIRRLLEYAEHRVLIETLLIWADKRNPNRYKQHQPYFYSVSEKMVNVPLFGNIAAGKPIMPFKDPYDVETNFIEVPEESVPAQGQIYALIVKGDSMIDALIFDGDIVLIDRSKNFDNGDIVVAWLIEQQETTLKCFYPEDHRIRLQPRNKTMQPIYVDPDKVEVYGRVIRTIPRFTVRDVPQID